MGFKVEFYFHSTNLPTYLALQGGPGLETEFYFHSITIYQQFWLYKRLKEMEKTLNLYIQVDRLLLGFPFYEILVAFCYTTV